MKKRMPELIRVEHLVKTYYLGKAQVPALKGVDLTIQTGEFMAIRGASGSGKIIRDARIKPLQAAEDLARMPATEDEAHP
jgi:ABC-type glutathione transport system ATPase component